MKLCPLVLMLQTSSHSSERTKEFFSVEILLIRMTEGTGHFSQTIWAKTKLVGCGYVHYKVKGVDEKT